VRSGHQGRITRELVEALTADGGKHIAFVCGPGITPHERRLARARGEDPAPRFVEHMAALLFEMGWGKHQIRQEAWG